MSSLGDFCLFLHSLPSEVEHIYMETWDRMSHALGAEGLRSALNPLLVLHSNNDDQL